MNKIIRRFYSLLVLFGIDPKKTYYSAKGLYWYFLDLTALKKQLRLSDKSFPLGKLYPFLMDRYDNSGTASGHYFHQDLLVARRIYLNNPNRHIDVGSRIDGFVAHVAAFRTIEAIDIRPLTNNLQNIKFIQADMMKSLDENLVNSCDSISCLHVIEHFGLGRYGDTVNHEGYKIGLNNLSRILKSKGKFYFSTPIGPQRIEFNAHRVFSVDFLLKFFSDKYTIDNFSYVDDQGNLHENANLDSDNIKTNYNCTYGCGIFEMTKK